MIDSELDPIIEQVALAARRPVSVDPDARERLLAVIRAEAATGTTGEWESRGTQRRFTLTATRFAALAAGLVGVGALLGFGLGRDSQETGHPKVVAEKSSQLPASPSADTVMTFVFVAHGASKVSLVGDFNQWNAEASPMQRIPNSDAWSVTVPLAQGRHVYSFLAVGADGERWVADPHAPAAPDDGFGHRNSVVVVGTGSTS